MNCKSGIIFRYVKTKLYGTSKLKILKVYDLFQFRLNRINDESSFERSYGVHVFLFLFYFYSLYSIGIKDLL